MHEQLFRSSVLTTPQPWEKVHAYLEARGHQFELEPAPRQFAGGLANLNYYVRFDGTAAVLRRPPPGLLALGANDMAREWSVTRQLCQHYPLCPRGLFFCPDTQVIGAPFLISEYRDGLIVRDELPPGCRMTTNVAERILRSLAEPMARLHALDPGQIGLGQLGRPDGFLQRQVAGWAKRGAAAYDDGMPSSLKSALRLLEGWQPEPAAPAILHMDFKLDNLILDADTFEPLAVIDWDMATRGDPLYDLAILLSYWIGPEDPAALQELQQMPSLTPGFPDRRAMVMAYERASCKPVLDLRQYLLLARVRLGIAWRQLYVQHRRGSLPDPRYATFDQLAHAILEFALEARDQPL
jgi:aminoglycoside phosphotransferase (APT) family kinase protein